MEFEADDRVAQMSGAYALDAVDVAQSNFKTALDGSEESVAVVEEILGVLHESMAADKPPDDLVWKFARIFGSYVGEVMRKNHGGRWGFSKDGGEKHYALERDGQILWPQSRAYKRLINGPEDNVWHYYQIMTRRADR
jgi:hypothetical protein